VSQEPYGYETSCDSITSHRNKYKEFEGGVKVITIYMYCLVILWRPLNFSCTRNLIKSTFTRFLVMACVWVKSRLWIVRRSDATTDHWYVLPVPIKFKSELCAAKRGRY